MAAVQESGLRFHQSGNPTRFDERTFRRIHKKVTKVEAVLGCRSADFKYIRLDLFR